MTSTSWRRTRVWPSILILGLALAGCRWWPGESVTPDAAPSAAASSPRAPAFSVPDPNGAQPASDQWVVAPARLNVRQHPSLNAPARLFLSKGEVVTSDLSQINDHHVWRRIQLDHADYWVAERNMTDDAVYLYPRALLDEPPQVAIPAHFQGTIIRIFKSERLLQLLTGTPEEWHPLKTMFIRLGAHPSGPKQMRGDQRTPEGLYYVTYVNAASRFGRDPDTGGPLASFALSYPNSGDAWRGFRNGVIDSRAYQRVLAQLAKKEPPPQDTLLGGDIMIHGSEDQISNWTEGCIALSDRDIKTLAPYITPGTWVEIRP
ncbi:MAG: L,D-transpeptidase family protein [Magnetococcales bacterium]|nr:L,D-transpeptidase family protein [Magnetococcales bacterium]